VSASSDVSCGAAQHDADADGEQAKLLAKLLYETALLESGFQLADNKAFNQRVYSLVKDVLDIKKDITAVQEPADDPAEVRRIPHALCRMLLL
jgi:hypothetical protein